MRQSRSLSYETVVHHGAVGNTAACGKHKALGNDVSPHCDRSLFRTCDRAVFETCGAFDVCICADVDIGNCAAVGDFGAFSHVSAFAEKRCGMRFNHCSESLSQLAVMAVHGDQISGLSRQPLINRHLPTACFVEHRHLGSDAESRAERAGKAVDIVDVHPVGDIVVRYVIGHVADENAITHRDVVQSDIAQTRTASQTAGTVKDTVEPTDPHLARKFNISEGPA